MKRMKQQTSEWVRKETYIYVDSCVWMRKIQVRMHTWHFYFCMHLTYGSQHSSCFSEKHNSVWGFFFYPKMFLHARLPLHIYIVQYILYTMHVLLSYMSLNVCTVFTCIFFVNLLLHYLIKYSRMCFKIQSTQAKTQYVVRYYCLFLWRIMYNMYYVLVWGVCSEFVRHTNKIFFSNI